jgi:hemolysin III
MKRRSKIQSLGEEIGNAVTHGIGAVLGVVYLILLLLQSTDVYRFSSALIFSLSVIVLYTMSTLYHAFPNHSTVKAVFKRFDHIGIYLLIGGSFTPLFYVVMDQPLGVILSLIQYAFIILGIVLKAVFIHRLQVLHIIVYLALGWSAVFLLEPLQELDPIALWLVISGGLAYTIGVIFYSTRLFKFSHMVWHLFVLLGTFFHFLSFYMFLFA